MSGLDKSRDKGIVPTCPRSAAARSLGVTCCREGKTSWLGAFYDLLVFWHRTWVLKVRHFIVKMWVSPRRWLWWQKTFIYHGCLRATVALNVNSCPCRAVPKAACLLWQSVLYWFPFPNAAEGQGEVLQCEIGLHMPEPALPVGWPLGSPLPTLQRKAAPRPSPSLCLCTFIILVSFFILQQKDNSFSSFSCFDYKKNKPNQT